MTLRIPGANSLWDLQYYWSEGGQSFVHPIVLAERVPCPVCQVTLLLFCGSTATTLHGQPQSNHGLFRTRFALAWQI